MSKASFYSRRNFLGFLVSSPVFSTLSGSTQENWWDDRNSLPLEQNVLHFQQLARERLNPVVFDFISGGADDMKTARASQEAFDKWQIRARRLVDVSRVKTGVEILGQTAKSPIFLSPVGAMGVIHPDGEPAAARAAMNRDSCLSPPPPAAIRLVRLQKPASRTPGSNFTLLATEGSLSNC